MKDNRTKHLYLGLAGDGTVGEHQHAIELRTTQHLAGLVQHRIDQVHAVQLAVRQSRGAVELAVPHMTVAADKAVAHRGAGDQLDIVADDRHVEPHIAVVPVIFGALGLVRSGGVLVVVVIIGHDGGKHVLRGHVLLLLLLLLVQVLLLVLLVLQGLLLHHVLLHRHA